MKCTLTGDRDGIVALGAAEEEEEAGLGAAEVEEEARFSILAADALAACRHAYKITNSRQQQPQQRATPPTRTTAVYMLAAAATMDVT